MTRPRILIALFVFAFLSVASLLEVNAAETLRGVALVIGQSDYRSLGKLANTQKDAGDVANLLREIGFDVTLLFDASHSKIDRAIQRFTEDAADVDVAVVYYSGHGVEVGGENYLIPIDADISTPETAGRDLVSVSDLVAAVQSKAAISIVLLDACRTSPFASDQLIRLPNAVSAQSTAAVGLAELRGPKPVRATGSTSLGTFIGFAASPGSSALDGPPGGNSPYASALLKHLTAAGYSFGDTMTLVTEEVYLKTNTRQLPWNNSALRRIITFGSDDKTSDGEQGAIIAGRRSLLMKIVQIPPPVRQSVEKISRDENISVATMYGVLTSIGENYDPTKLTDVLLASARTLRQQPHGLEVVTSSDPEVRRLRALAQEAQDEGVLNVALDLSLEASARAQKLSGELDRLESDLGDRRRENAIAFAEAGSRAQLRFELQTAVGQFELAVSEIEKSPTQGAAEAEAYRLRLAESLVYLGVYQDNNDALKKAIRLLEHLLKDKANSGRQDESVQVRTLLGEATGELGFRTSDLSLLSSAISNKRIALEGVDRAINPLDWAAGEHGLGTTLLAAGIATEDTELLKEALTAYALALEVRVEKDFDRGWSLSGLGLAQKNIGRLEDNADMVQQAVHTFVEALGLISSESDPVAWGMVQRDLGSAFVTLSNFQGQNARLDDALTSLRQSVSIQDRRQAPGVWASAEKGLGMVLNMLGTSRSDPRFLRESVEALSLAIGETKRTSQPKGWAELQGYLGNSLYHLGDLTDGVNELYQAADAFERQLEVMTKTESKEEWATATETLGYTWLAIGQIIGDPAHIEKARDLLVQVWEVTPAEDRDTSDYRQRILSEIDVMHRELVRDQRG